MRRGRWLLPGLLLALTGCMEGVKPEPLPRADFNDPTKRQKDDNRQLALFRAQLLTVALTKYREANDELPETLEALTEPGKDGRPYVERDVLLDPWGRRYKYDRAGPKNAGKQPDVWSVGPDARPGQEVGNWTPFDE
jgi:hypothetical protein